MLWGAVRSEQAEHAAAHNHVTRANLTVAERMIELMLEEIVPHGKDEQYSLVDRLATRLVRDAVEAGRMSDMAVAALEAITREPLPPFTLHPAPESFTT